MIFQSNFERKNLVFIEQFLIARFRKSFSRRRDVQNEEATSYSIEFDQPAMSFFSYICPNPTYNLKFNNQKTSSMMTNKMKKLNLYENCGKFVLLFSTFKE